MKSLWNPDTAAPISGDPLALRVYTSRLLGQEPDLVLHGGGNTSVKIREKNLFGEEEDLIYVKGSGWDLGSIEAAGFAPVRMETLIKMAALPLLSDAAMVNHQRAAMTNPNAPNPSVEAILHAIIPFRFVDHTHADAVVTISNTPDGPRRIREIYNDEILVMPYVMPGFILARQIYEATRDLDWSKCRGIILLHHGVFTFADDARESYENMISLVSRAEEYLASAVQKSGISAPQAPILPPNLNRISKLRKQVSLVTGRPVLTQVHQEEEALAFANLPGVAGMATRGPVTPDHVIRTKRIPLVLEQGGEDGKRVQDFATEYKAYFHRNSEPGQTCLDPGPRWGVWEKMGCLSFGRNPAELEIISDITAHTRKCIRQAEALGGWKALSEKEIFDLEYWELEQAKLKKAGNLPAFKGRIALVTGAASGIGKACVKALRARGAVVAALDIDPGIQGSFRDPGVMECICDVRQEVQIGHTLRALIMEWGGLDMIISNAGNFPAGAFISAMPQDRWENSLSLNLTSHQKLLTACIPYLKEGWEPSAVIIGSKNVAAPGPGVAAYSVAKAGLTQLARVAALELAPAGIRVNVIHPDAVYDTGIWTDEILQARAAHYGMTVEQYKARNLLKTEVTSADVAELACTLAGKAFARTTGAQIPIDGGNDRVI